MLGSHPENSELRKSTAIKHKVTPEFLGSQTKNKNKRCSFDS